MADHKIIENEDYIYFIGEKEWKIGVDPASIQHEPFNPDLPIKYKIEFEGDKLNEYIEFIDKKIHSGMGIPFSILFGSTPLPEATNTHAIHLEDNEEEVATEDPPANNFRLVNGFTYNMTEIKQHPMDKHYPHICYKCKRDLFWKELQSRNIYWTTLIYSFNNRKSLLLGKTISLQTVSFEEWLFNIKKYRHLKQLWRSSVVQFYCCDCYDEMMEEL